jgi:hypothetical protein
MTEAGSNGNVVKLSVMHMNLLSAISSLQGVPPAQWTWINCIFWLKPMEPFFCYLNIKFHLDKKKMYITSSIQKEGLSTDSTFDPLLMLAGLYL